MLSEQVLAQWWHTVTSSEALDLLHWAMRMVLYQCIAMAIETASFVGVFVDCCLFAVALADAGAIRSRKLSNVGIQWLPE